MKKHYTWNEITIFLDIINDLRIMNTNLERQVKELADKRRNISFNTNIKDNFGSYSQQQYTPQHNSDEENNNNGDDENT